MIKVRASLQDGWSKDIELWVADFRDNRLFGILSDLVMDNNPEIGVIRDTPIKISMENAQSLMDELWQCGIRPSEGTGSAGALAATQKHLEDMRKLVFKE